MDVSRNSCVVRVKEVDRCETPTCLEESERDEYGWPSMQPCGMDDTLVRERPVDFSPGRKTLTSARAPDDV